MVNVDTDGNEAPVFAFMIENSIPYRDRPGTNLGISASVPISLIIPLSEVPEVTYISPVFRPFHASSQNAEPQSRHDAKSEAIFAGPIDDDNPVGGSVETTNDAIWHGGNNWHPSEETPAVGFDGRGINIGIIDDGFQNIGTVLNRFGLVEDDINSRCYRKVTFPDRGTVNHVTFDILDHCEMFVFPTIPTHGSNVLGALLVIAPKADYYIASLADIRDFHEVASW